jgi:hypothetical protein
MTPNGSIRSSSCAVPDGALTASTTPVVIALIATDAHLASTPQDAAECLQAPAPTVLYAHQHSTNQGVAEPMQAAATSVEHAGLAFPFLDAAGGLF